MSNKALNPSNNLDFVGDLDLGDLALSPPTPDIRHPFLRFQLGQETALIPLVQATEILPLEPVDILPIPAVPVWVLGVYDWRGEFLWLLDLECLVGLPSVCSHTAMNRSQARSAQLQGVVVRVNHQSLGVVVRSIADIELHDETALKPVRSGLFPDTLLPYLGGYFIEGGPVLDLRSLATLPVH
ncbi:MAG: chemotaxis protein CheW [Cyanobacteria bacterium P01_E01_bin.34]